MSVTAMDHVTPVIQCEKDDDDDKRDNDDDLNSGDCTEILVLMPVFGISAIFLILGCAHRRNK